MGRKLFWILLVLLVTTCCASRTPIARRPVKENARWQARRFPLQVGLVGLEGCRTSKMVQAITYWNSELAKVGAPLPAFEIVRVPEMDRNQVGHLWVTEGPLPKHEKSSILGTCQLGYFEGTPKIWGAVLTMSNAHCLWRVSVHELGHALGLQHAPDECEGCIMHEFVPRFEGHLVDQGWLREEELRYVAGQMR